MARTRDLPVVLRCAILLEAWSDIEVRRHDAWLRPPLVVALLRREGLAANHLTSLHLGHDHSARAAADAQTIAPVEEQPIASEDTFPVEDTGKPNGELEAALTAARDRGRKRVAEIVAGEEMLSAETFAKLLGMLRVTANAKRQTGQVPGIDGDKRGFRFPVWQLDKDGRPFGALPALNAMLGNSAWAVYRFLATRHGGLNGRTGLRAIQQGDDAAVLAAAEGMARGDFD